MVAQSTDSVQLMRCCFFGWSCPLGVYQVCSLVWLAIQWDDEGDSHILPLGRDVLAGCTVCTLYIRVVLPWPPPAPSCCRIEEPGV
ncbi:hypothetical protein BDV41DRAFT_557613 [Aspergillus transmontanensis]|uniref:Uncharacterized protein n=1 Tax=Aspergillus transmontanensis TaxID=1034304 RepID=A0A5N6VHG9_9EURO|nr:hypothetical protein BDV41DRAFT_557613 [Aspergillus transmontanensis]